MPECLIVNFVGFSFLPFRTTLFLLKEPMGDTIVCEKKQAWRRNWFCAEIDLSLFSILVSDFLPPLLNKEVDCVRVTQYPDDIVSCSRRITGTRPGTGQLRAGP